MQQKARQGDSRQGREAQAGNIVSESGSRKGRRHGFPISVKCSVSKTSAALWGSMKGKPQRSSRESRWVCRGTLLGGTRTEIHDRKGMVSSRERPHRQD